jgi:HlyD family secretion protein
MLTIAKIRSHGWSLGICAVVAGLAAWQAARLYAGPLVAIDRVQRGTLIETIVATGNVETAYRVSIASQIVGTVREVQVKEGQRVTAGQVLIVLDPHELIAGVAQAQGAVAQAEAHMAQLREVTVPTASDTLKQAQSTLLNAQQAFDRASILVRKGDETRVVLDAAQKDLDLARTQVRMDGLQVYTNSPGGSDYVAGVTQLNQAVANRETAVSRLGYATITAPRAGVLIDRNVEVGAVAQPGTALLVLAPDGVTQLHLAIDERNLGKLALAQKAVASADAYPRQRFDAVVSYINPSVDIAKASVEVKLDVADPPPYLRQDMTVSVDIEVARSDSALILPGRSVRQALSAAPWVMVVRDGHATKQPVRLGVQGATQTEVREGLAAGEPVISPASATLAGDRVRVALP